MKITTISLQNNIPIKTGGNSCSFYINNIIGQGNELTFLYFLRDNNPNGETPKSINFTSKYIKKKHTFHLLPKLLQKMNFEFLFRNSELKKIKTDIILLESPYLYHIAKIISKTNNDCPIYLLEHNIESEYYHREGFIFYKFIKIYEERVIKNVDKIITISQHDYGYIKKINADTHYIKLGVSRELFNPDGDAYNFEDKQFNILFYGSLSLGFNKNALNFIYDQLSPQLDGNFSIHICGKSSDSIETKDNIIYHGFVDKIQKFIRGCDAVIVPISGTVGVNMRVLESLFCGKIVLVSRDSYQGLDNDLKKIVFKCDSLNDYITVLKKLQTNHTYRSQYEKDIKRVVEKYVNQSENILKQLFRV